MLAIDDVEIAFTHFLKVFWLVVQLRHDAERLLLRPIRHVHEVSLQILHAPFFERSDFPCIWPIHKPHHIQIRLMSWIIEDEGVLALHEEFLEDDVDIVVVNHLPHLNDLWKVEYCRGQAGG